MQIDKNDAEVRSNAGVEKMLLSAALDDCNRDLDHLDLMISRYLGDLELEDLLNHTVYELKCKMLDKFADLKKRLEEIENGRQGEE